MLQLLNYKLMYNFSQKIYFLLLILTTPSLEQIVYDIIKGGCDLQGWTVQNPASNGGCYSSWKCQTNPEFSIQQQSLLSKTFILEPHYKISFKGLFYAYYYDISENQQIQFLSDNTLLNFIQDKTQHQISTCDNYITYYINLHEIELYHTSNSLMIFINLGYYWWSIKSLQLTVYYCNLNCKFCEFSGECIYFSRYMDLNLNPLSTIEGWFQNGVPNTNNYQLIGTSSEGLQIYDFASGLNNNGYLFEKVIPIAIPGEFRISFKTVAQTWQTYRIRIFVNQILLLDRSSLGDLIVVSCSGLIFKVEQYQITFVKTQKNIKLGIIYNYISSYCNYVEDQYLQFGIRDLEIYYNEKECPDGNLLPFDGCHSELYSCVEGCRECLRGKCYKCQEGFQYVQFNCIPICGDSIIKQYEECDDGNNIPYDGCYKCKFSCPLNCANCQFGKCKSFIQIKYFDTITNFNDYGFNQHQMINDQSNKYKISQEKIKCLEGDYTLLGFYYQICSLNNIQWCQKSLFKQCFQCKQDYELEFNKQICKAKCNNDYLQEFEQCDDNNNIQFDGCYNCQNNCQKECLMCERQKCLKCKEGWKLDNDSCYQICGDGVIAYGSYEECDDGNDISGDGCYECKIECSLNCKYCATPEVCYYCFDHFQLINNYCYPICGDKIVIDDLEECDDGNNIEFDGCHNCFYSCPEICFQCEQGKCLQRCDYGYYYNDQICQLQCGDQIVLSNEECDDGNNIEFDGCHNCLYSCPQICFECEKGKCLQQCDYGYYYNDQICESKCGDKIVASNEECDDGDDIEFDGCYQCLNSCSVGCRKCLNGKCLQCFEEYELKNYQCYDPCGNGKRNNYEECDDGNNVRGDGCDSNCLLEKYFFCITQFESITECEKQPLLQLNYLSKNFEVQYVSISFTKQVMLLSQNQTFIEQLQSIIIELNPLQYEIEIITVSEISYNDFTYGEYKIKIQFLQTISETSTLSILFNKDLQIIDENYLNFDQKRNYNINLQPCFLLSEDQISRSIQLQSLGTFLILGLSSIGFLMLLAGYFFEFLDIFDLLQYQSYLRYLNLCFPQNLYIYFQVSDLVSLAPILEFLQINNILCFAFGQEYLQSIYQFKQYEINADFLTNIYSQIAQFSLALIIIIFLSVYKRFYFKNCFTRKHFYHIKIQKSFVLKKAAFIFYIINKNILAIQNYFSSEGLKQIFLVNSWDLTFKVLLFIVSNFKFGIREILSYISCGGYLIYAIFYLITFYKKQSHKAVQGNQIRDLHQTIILIKRIFFILVLINLQATPLLQGILQSCTSILYIGILLSTNLVENRQDFKVILMTEVPILLFTLSALSYSPDFVENISEENRITLGFAQIGVLILGLTAPLLKHINVIIQKGKQYIEKTCSAQKPQIANSDWIFGISVSTLIQPKKFKR